VETPTPPIKKRSRFKWLLYLTFWAMLVVVFGYVAMAQASQYGSLRHEIAQIELEIERALEAHEALQRQLLFIGSDAYIEQQARERLGMLLPTQIAFRVLGR